MPTPYDNLPLPDANEYPYNLQGDQTKARALADAARAGNSSALERLRTLGLDDGGNLAPYTPNENTPTPTPNTNPNAPAPNTPNVYSAPNSYPDVEKIAAQRLKEDKRRADQENAQNQREANESRAQRQDESTRAPLPDRPTTSAPARSQPNSNTQSVAAQRLEYDRSRWGQSQAKDARDFAESKRRFDEQTALAKQRQNFQEQKQRQEEAADRIAAADKAAQSANRPTGGLASKSSQQPITARGGGKGGGGKGGGGGGGGGGGAKSPEQKAREKGREDRRADREKRKTEKTAQRRSNEEYAKSQGFNNLRAMQDQQARDEFFGRNREKNNGEGGSGNTADQPFDRNKPVTDPYTGEKMSADDYEKLARERIKNDKSLNPSEKRDWSKNPPVSDADVDNYNADMGIRPPKMVRAYGNKHSKVWVRARGDYA